MKCYECAGIFKKCHTSTKQKFNFAMLWRYGKKTSEYKKKLKFLPFCSNTREESCEGALIIHKIMQNKPAFMLNDDSYYSKMKSFTLQILNRKKVKKNCIPM